MNYNGNIYAELLLYSFVVGVALGMLYDLFMILRDLMFGNSTVNLSDNVQNNFSNNASNASSSNTDKTLIPLTQADNSCIKLALKLFSPHRKREIIFDLISDLLFWLIAAVTIVLLLFQLNSGEIRAFTLVVAAFGALLYHFTLGRLIRRVLVFLTVWEIRIIKQILKLILSPIIFLSKRITLFILKNLEKKHDILRRKQYRQELLSDAENGFGILKQ